MAIFVSFSAFFLLLHLLPFLILLFPQEVKSEDLSNCTRFQCGSLGEMRFPFVSTQMPSTCGLYKMNCTRNSEKVQLEQGGKWYKIEAITHSKKLIITDLELEESIKSNDCDKFSASCLPESPWLFIEDAITLFKCNQSVNDIDMESFYCKGYNFYYQDRNHKHPKDVLPGCLAIRVPAHSILGGETISSALKSTFDVKLKVPGRCYGCHYDGGICSAKDNGGVQCDGEKVNPEKLLKLKIVVGGAILLLTIILLAMLIIRHRFRRRIEKFPIQSREISDNSCTKSDIEDGELYFKVPIFSNKELLQATNKFSTDNLLGHGGFGAVYYGKLGDGREVAVKCLFEHNGRRVEQFMNEIEILTRLQHKNLVSLYGCTSRRTNELFLVYEFVPHGTVADHLHSKQANISNPLPWHIRLNIAIETATALAYLHASDIIHRDVKTTNILLDKNFGVKVADFGLSRLHPTDATHVSTAPQGTPGYVDPEYHQFYQLTDKSDVYSFGVVLVELISSLPAFDPTRVKAEINLSHMAINKIQKHEVHKLIDPNLGYEIDEKVRTMTRQVAELAFQCLQQDKDLRPTMEEVLQELKRVQKLENKPRNREEVHEDRELTKKNRRFSSSPNTVTEKWVSSYTTSNTTCG